VMGSPDLPDDDSLVRFYINRMSAGALNVHTVHAETEGMGHLATFTSLVWALKERGAHFVRLCDVAARLTASELPICAVIRTTLPGRAGWISAQGPEKSALVPKRPL
jgi:hypothetical protein